MDRKTFLAILKFARSRGFEGKTFEQFKGWAEQPETNLGVFDFGDGKTYTLDDVKAAWDSKAVKTVTVSISADAGEDVVVQDASAQTEELDDEEDMKEMDEDEEIAKSAARRKKFRESQDKWAGVKRVDAKAGRERGGAKWVSTDDRAKSLYDRAVKSGERFRGKRPVFLDAERSELFGAWSRFKTMGPYDYSQKSRDEEIITKAGAVGQNSTGGALVFGEYFPELIENLESYGAARKAIGVTPMAEGERTVSKISDDVTVYDIGEGDAITASDPTFGNVKLVAAKTAALYRANSELLNDSAFNIGDIVARSISRAIGKYEDDSVFLGSNNRTGVSDLVGANTTHDAALSSAWTEFDIDDMQAMAALLPAWAWDDPALGYVCSMPFAQTVFMKFGLDAGGNTGTDIRNGFGELRFNGLPIYISQSMPKARDGGDDLVCYLGAWSHACKFGVVTGSEEMATSDQRYFDQDQVAYRYTQRWDFALHDVNNTANASGVVALQD